MNKPYLSIIIPHYNAPEFLERLLGTIARSKGAPPFEVIVGDDCSQSNIKYQISKIKYTYTKIPIDIIFLRKNKGPAAARNVAARKAKGEVLVFLDCDVEVYSNTLKNIADMYRKDPDVVAVTGVWDKHQRTRAFFPQFKALRDWSYWINESDRGGYYYLFSTRIAAIRRAVFARLGGFNEDFRQMEDVELTYRIASRYAILFAKDVRVHHEFEGFVTVARKYFWRSFYWSKIWDVRRKFDTVATTSWETVTALTGVGALGVVTAGMVLYYFVPAGVIRSATLVLACGLATAHVILLRKFLTFVWREKGGWFTIRSLVTGLALYVCIVGGAGYYFLKRRI